ncbi:hypothetical protein [Streptomyces sp. NPDC086787]|uniref:hypothetical protein n=1 Tax=Streptomyces sp. NPDC086787 TaxID=3365759 RepID=UPI0037F11449
MRRTTLHGTTATALAAAALLLTGCGSQDGASGAGSGDKVSPSGDASPSRSGGASGNAADCVRNAQLAVADNGRTVCVVKGGRIRLTLDGTRERPWKPVAAGGHVLKAANPGFVVLPGDAVAAYDAMTPGTVRLTSSRPPSEGAAQWAVTVVVR